MKDKSRIIKNFRSKINELRDHNKFYFSEDNPKITDEKYDELKKDIFLLEKNYSFLKKLNLTKIQKNKTFKANVVSIKCF